MTHSFASLSSAITFFSFSRYWCFFPFSFSSFSTSVYYYRWYTRDKKKAYTKKYVDKKNSLLDWARTKKTIYAQWLSFHLLCTFHSIVVPAQNATDTQSFAEYDILNEILNTAKKGENRIYISNTFSFFLSYRIRSLSLAFVSWSSCFVNFIVRISGLIPKNKSWKSTCLHILYHCIIEQKKKVKTKSGRWAERFACAFEIKISFCCSRNSHCFLHFIHLYCFSHIRLKKIPIVSVQSCHYATFQILPQSVFVWKIWMKTKIAQFELHQIRFLMREYCKCFEVQMKVSVQLDYAVIECWFIDKIKNTH